MGLVWLAGFAWLYFAVYSPQLHGSDLTSGGSDAFFSRTAYAPLPAQVARRPALVCRTGPGTSSPPCSATGRSTPTACWSRPASGGWPTRSTWLLLMIVGVFAVAVGRLQHQRLSALSPAGAVPAAGLYPDGRGQGRLPGPAHQGRGAAGRGHRAARRRSPRCRGWPRNLRLCRPTPTSRSRRCWRPDEGAS